MANLKNITDLPITESAEGLNLIVNDNGSAKQIAASAVGAQADWAETDENSPAYVKNKPVEEWDLDIIITQVTDAEDNNADPTYVVNSINTFANIKNKILNGAQPKCKCQAKRYVPTEETLAAVETFDSMFCTWVTNNDNGEEAILFTNWGNISNPFFTLLSDESIIDITLNH